MELPAHTHKMGFYSCVAPHKHCADFTALNSSWFLFSSFSPDSSHPWLCGCGLFLPFKGHLQLMSHRQSQLPAVFAEGPCADLFSYCELSWGLFKLFCEYWFILNNKAYFQGRQTLNWCFKSVFFTTSLFLLKYEELIFQGSIDQTEMVLSYHFLDNHEWFPLQSLWCA